MAGKATSVWVSIVDKQHKTVEHKMFFNMNGAKAYKKENEEKFPKPEYTFIIETY
jgi:predicted peroxiredoxin